MPHERRNPSISYAYKTAVFRIHNPSRHKRAMLDDALTRYHRAYCPNLIITPERINRSALNCKTSMPGMTA